MILATGTYLRPCVVQYKGTLVSLHLQLESWIQQPLVTLVWYLTNCT